ncbi:hypothetical protein L1987_09507 [Smallanthus sonchifolius]|uniref:Uncharacterized protein n=1 Tax=Smallanthus sonchifolius TaxID=185202 RepID=A0ACB9JP11_9ASTR|nr:hypothetical protein L1987_09507 [Smallanthus sonchifolius]
MDNYELVIFDRYSAARPCTRNCFECAEIARVMNAAGRRRDALPQERRGKEIVFRNKMLKFQTEKHSSVASRYYHSISIIDVWEPIEEGLLQYQAPLYVERPRPQYNNYQRQQQPQQAYNAVNEEPYGGSYNGNRGRGQGGGVRGGRGRGWNRGGYGNQGGRYGSYQGGDGYRNYQGGGGNGSYQGGGCGSYQGEDGYKNYQGGGGYGSYQGGRGYGNYRGNRGYGNYQGGGGEYGNYQGN